MQPKAGEIDILSFWGKARPIDPSRGPGWHPLAFHSLDVAAVGEALLTRHQGLESALLDLLGVAREDTRRLIRFLLAVHDIGKFARKFQAKVPNRYPVCFGDDPVMAAFYDHGAGGMRLFGAAPDLFSLPSGTSSGVWRPLISAVTGHHGTPPPAGIGDGYIGLRPDFGRSGIEAAGAFIQRARELFALPEKLPSLDCGRLRRASFAVAGFAVLSDWIGSNQKWFPYQDPVAGLEAYWRLAQERAAAAIEQADVLPASTSCHLAYRDLIGTRAAPSPMQDWARTVELPDGPALFLIEDETGSGKTEAALMLAHRLMTRGRADGLYIALPTMATANAMFDRIAAKHRQLFASDANPSVALAHGARDLHPGFRSAMLRGGRDEEPYSDASEQQDESGTTASAACAAWVADDRRRSFLADVGVGTIDQALLSVLPSRYQSLRLLGLMRRVLVLDEVHAYDAYMQREMERLLEFQAALGGSAILLSATLPLRIRERLTAAFATGTGTAKGHADTSMEYPLATVCTAGRLSSTSVAGQPGRARTLPVRFLRSADEALSAVERAAHDGHAALYVRNTVDDALEAHAQLAARGLESDVFHARFALVDRLELEKRIVTMFGKCSRRNERAGRVLIATQVVEQSLDLDFDVLVSDLAPVDLLIQRAGRLWRHDRPDRAGELQMLVVGPEPVEDADEEWFARTFPRAKYVYRDHARLWLTARTLKGAGAIESPTGLRALIESVYGDECDASLPQALLASLDAAAGRTGADRGVATANVLDVVKGYVRNGGAWDSDVRTPTRLDDDPQVTLRLARVRAGRIEPYAHAMAPQEPWRAWRLSEVNVSSRRVGGEDVSLEHVEAAKQARAGWTRYDAEKLLVVLERVDDDREHWSGSAASARNDGEVRLRYDPTRGLEFSSDDCSRPNRVG